MAPKGNEKYVALTFDEGPSGATKQILQVLKEKGVTATFFLSGDAAEASPATAKAIVDAGCEVGSNSYRDESLKGQDRDAVREQVSKGTEAIKSVTGTSTMLLRAPYAAFDEQNWIDAMDLVSAVVSWNIDSGDWLLNGADEQVSTVLDSVTPGNIVLLTDNDECAEQTLEALPAYCRRLQNRDIERSGQDGYIAEQKAHLADEGRHAQKRRVPPARRR